MLLLSSILLSNILPNNIYYIKHAYYPDRKVVIRKNLKLYLSHLRFMISKLYTQGLCIEPYKIYVLLYTQIYMYIHKCTNTQQSATHSVPQAQLESLQNALFL